jgi:copper chaperone CopZ
MSTVNTIVEDLDIEGMSCRHCVDTVKGALAALESVTVEDVEIGRARISHPARSIRPGQLEDVLEEAGFPLRGRRQIS